MIKPINSSLNSFQANNKAVNPQTGEYQDPLMRWPLRGAAFTNEVGEALRPLIGEYATLSWVPALLYIGADIYDKYKNDQTEYSPDSKRGFKQAVFQGLASIVLPLVAVKAGQNLFSLFGLLDKDKISYNSKEHVAELAQQFIANGKIRAHRYNEEEGVKEFVDSVLNSRDFKRLNRSFEKKENVEKYAENTIKTLFKMRKDLLNPSKEFTKDAWYSFYNESLNKGQTKNVAIKTVLSKLMKNKMLKGRSIKTLGGFIALGIAIKPIDKFVEELLNI